MTGGAGFIGANFTHYWLARHPSDRIVVLDALTYAGNLASLGPALSDPRLTFVHGDIRASEAVATLLREHAITTLVHFAAESHVDRSIAGPDVFLATNVLGTQALLTAACQVWLEEGGGRDEVRFHHISTDEVYGSLGPDDPPFTEASPYAPSSPYAASKAASDHLVLACHRTHGLPVTITHCSNNYGPFQFPEKLIPLMLVHALRGEPLPLYGDGLQVRDWLHVMDHCRAIDRLLSAGRVGQRYNVGGRNERINLDVVRLLCSLLDEMFGRDRELARRFPRCPAAKGQPTASLLTHVRDRPGHDRRYALSNRKAEQELGFEPTEDFESGIRKTVTWYLDREDWWCSVMDGSYRDRDQGNPGMNVSF